MVGYRSHGRLKGGFGEGDVRICGPTTQVPASVHFWADAHGCRNREGELGRGGAGLPLFTLSLFTLVIEPGWNKIRVKAPGKNPNCPCALFIHSLNDPN